ncbi:hypothetical protein B0H11DRAFT_1939494 [Mycena galericulata]|nr:hypothetical protein B0H11DRAFT_1939494 [Mycena galericulata]
MKLPVRSGARPFTIQDLIQEYEAAALKRDLKSDDPENEVARVGNRNGGRNADIILGKEEFPELQGSGVSKPVCRRGWEGLVETETSVHFVNEGMTEWLTIHERRQRLLKTWFQNAWWCIATCHLTMMWVFSPFDPGPGHSAKMVLFFLHRPRVGDFEVQISRRHHCTGSGSRLLYVAIDQIRK